MSHIDEALRRAAGQTLRERQTRDEFTLDDYPHEPPGSELTPRRLRSIRRPSDVLDPAPPRPVRSLEPAPVPQPPRDGGLPAAPPLRPGILPATTVPAVGFGAGEAEPVVEAGPGLLRQYRRLGETLHEAQQGRGARRVLVTSVGDEAGKVRAAMDLALTLTRTFGTRGLIIDADLQAPRLHTIVGAPNDWGLVDLLNGSGGESVLIQVSPLLRLLPAGLSSSGSLAELASDAMRAIVDEAAAQYDWVLVTGPSFSSAKGSGALAHMCDGVIFVVDTGTPFPQVEQAIAAIGRARILGTVLNGLE